MTKVEKKLVDPIPEELSSYEEAAEFWETHDTTDCPDDFHTVDVVAEDVAKALRAQAKEKGIPVDRLASDLLRQQLAGAVRPQ